MDIAPSLRRQVSSLPTYAEPSVVVAWFHRVFDALEAHEVETAEARACLTELADQQWHQYTLMPEAELDAITARALALLDPDDDSDARVLATLAACLGFRVDVVRALLSACVGEAVGVRLRRDLADARDGRLDPYASLLEPA